MHTCKVIVALCVCWWGATSIAFAHIEYYDLNQGAQIADLTDAGKAIAGVQVGASTPQDLPLVKSAYWTPAYQTYSGAGNFTGVTYTPKLPSGKQVDRYGQLDGIQRRRHLFRLGILDLSGQRRVSGAR
jgi:hypothetical protein